MLCTVGNNCTTSPSHKPIRREKTKLLFLQTYARAQSNPGSTSLSHYKPLRKTIVLSRTVWLDIKMQYMNSAMQSDHNSLLESSTESKKAQQFLE